MTARNAPDAPLVVTPRRKSLRDELYAAADRFERELPAWMRAARRAGQGETDE